MLRVRSAHGKVASLPFSQNDTRMITDFVDGITHVEPPTGLLAGQETSKG